MKKILFVFIALILAGTIQLSAQTDSIPNAGFENWQNDSLPEKINSWGDLNSLSYPQFHVSSLEKSADHQHGNYSVKIKTISDGTNVVNGGITLGDVYGILGGHSKGGISYKSKPDSMHFYYKSNIATKDTATVLLVFAQSGIFIGAGKATITTSQPGWTRMDSAIGYLTSFVSPDAVYALITSGSPNDPHLNSWVMIDNFTLTKNGSTTGVSQLPNNDFENWTIPTYLTANKWHSSDDFAAPFNQPLSLAQTTDAHAGKYAAQLTTKINSSAFGPDTLGFLLSGPLPIKKRITGGFPYRHRPASFSFYYKYSSFNGLDSAIAGVWFYKKGKTLDSVMITLPSANSYTKTTITIPNALDTSLTPDTVTIGFASSDLNYGKPRVADGSELKIDDLTFAGGNTGFEAERDIKSFNIFPNPVNKIAILEFDAKSASNGSFTLYDVTGRVVYANNGLNIKAGNNTIKLDVSTLESGLYLFKCENSKDVQSGKIVIEK